MSRILPFLGRRGGRKGHAPTTDQQVEAAVAHAPKQASRADRLVYEAIVAHQRKLLSRIGHLEGRAGRAKVNSNERQRCDAERLVLTSCLGHLHSLRDRAVTG